MTTKPPASVKKAEENSPTKKIYTMVEEFKDIIPVANDRNRLAFFLHRFYTGETGSIKEAISACKPESSTVDMDHLEKMISEKYENLNLK